MIPIVIDTNVLVVANAAATPNDYNPQCVLACTRRLLGISRGGDEPVVVDDGWRILREYQRNILPIRSQGSVGSEFLLWLLTNQSSSQHCIQQRITLNAPTDPDDFVEFPQDQDLTNFDRADRKFVAVALAHPAHPPIINATDSDWYHYAAVLERHGVQIEQLCIDDLKAQE